MNWFSRLVERQINKARLKGELERLKGEGEPLPDRPGDAFVDPGIAAGFRIMAEAGVLPEEIVLQKEIAKAKAHYRTLTDKAEKKAAMKHLAELEMKHAIAVESRKKFLGP